MRNPARLIAKTAIVSGAQGHAEGRAEAGEGL
jgi:hypothetical protein